jgi:NAD(P)-dependent dehydrogenase (short-subunit alcohol dehydrogenase family)
VPEAAIPRPTPVKMTPPARPCRDRGTCGSTVGAASTETERVEQLFRQRAEATGSTPEEVRATAIAKEGLRRLGRPEDVAALALFLCSERSRHIQGTAIAVDGGATPGVY